MEEEEEAEEEEVGRSARKWTCATIPIQTRQQAWDRETASLKSSAVFLRLKSLFVCPFNPLDWICCGSIVIMTVDPIQMDESHQSCRLNVQGLLGVITDMATIRVDESHQSCRLNFQWLYQCDKDRGWNLSIPYSECSGVTRCYNGHSYYPGEWKLSL